MSKKEKFLLILAGVLSTLGFAMLIGGLFGFMIGYFAAIEVLKYITAGIMIAGFFLLCMGAAVEDTYINPKELDRWVELLSNEETEL